MKGKNLFFIFLSILIFGGMGYSEEVNNEDKASNKLLENQEYHRNLKQGLNDIALITKTSASSVIREFTFLPSLGALSITAGLTAIALHNDQAWTDQIGNSVRLSKGVSEGIGYIGVVFSTGAIPISLWFTKNPKLRAFAIEAGASLLLTNIQALLVSFIPMHERPSNADLNFFEKAFRAESSFPSGHVVGVASFATNLLFYDVPSAVAIYGVTALIGYQRLEVKEHFVSDIIGGIGLGVAGALAVRSYLGETAQVVASPNFLGLKILF